MKCKEFIHRKVKQIEDLQDKYQKLTLEERRKYDYEFDKLKDEFCDMIIKIANGRVNSFKLRSQPNLVNHIDDIMQDAVIQVFRYINRFDESRGTSAFSYVTEQCSNAIKQDLKKIQEHDKTYVSGIDFFDNINTIDNHTPLAPDNHQNISKTRSASRKFCLTSEGALHIFSAFLLVISVKSRTFAAQQVPRRGD